MADPTLDAFGWTPELALAHAPHAALGREPARVVAEDRGRYQVIGTVGELAAAISGRFRHEAANDPSTYPAVGDWVAFFFYDKGYSVSYTLSFRRKGSEQWLRLRDNVDETSMNFDTSQLPDGEYELRLSVTDAQDNPDGPLTDSKEGIDFRVDNTAPAITFTTEGDDVVIRVTDKLSTIGKVEYSADAQKWIRITPVDGISDSPSETYRLKRGGLTGKFVIVRAVDSFYNVATESIPLP